MSSFNRYHVSHQEQSQYPHNNNSTYRRNDGGHFGAFAAAVVGESSSITCTTHSTICEQLVHVTLFESRAKEGTVVRATQNPKVHRGMHHSVLRLRLVTATIVLV